nr:DUF4097 family beta strand repeat-containing protein [Paenibacillus xylanexedens]
MSTKKWLALALVCIGIGLLGTSVYGFQFNDDREAYSKRWDLNTGGLQDDLQNIQLDGNFDADIEFIVSPDNTAYIEVDGKWEPEVIQSFEEASFTDGTFQLTLQKHNRLKLFSFNWNWGEPDSRITVALPEGYPLNDVTLHSSSADWDITGLHAESLEMKSTSGSIVLRDIQVPRMELSLTSGDITASAIQGDLAVEQTSGSFTAKQVDGKVNSVIQSGDVEIAQLNGEANVEFTSGSIDIQQSHAAPIQVSGTSGDISIQAAPDFDGIYEAKATSGDVNIPESPGISQDVIQARTTSGSIRITQPR